MTLYQAVILGIVQGITEFFPISSSGHLVLFQSMFGLKEELAFDIFLHLGTLVSIFIFFYKDIIGLFAKDRKTLLFLLIASVPTFMMGFLFKDAVEKLFSLPLAVGIALTINGFWLIFATVYAFSMERRGVKKELGILNSIIVGIAQGIAIVPGISRSGSTISAGMLSGLDKEKAFKFAFLLAIPAIAGASLLKAYKIGSDILNGDAIVYFAGAFTAMIVGIVSIKFLLKIVKNNKLYIFGIYCILVAGFIIARAFLNG